MALVTCFYCKQKFDREKVPFVQFRYGAIGPKPGEVDTRPFRYGHSTCYINAVNEGKEKRQLDIWDPATSSTCFWCHEAIFPNHPDVIPMPQLNGRYVHKKCAAEHPKNDYEELTIYIIKLFKLKDDYILPKYAKQLSQYEREYNFSYSGMLKALKYQYEVKHNPIDLDKGVGIIPYVYKKAYDYYYALWLGDQQNQQKDLNEYIPKDIEITIRRPEPKIEKRKLFNFLDEEVEKSE